MGADLSNGWTLATAAPAALIHVEMVVVSCVLIRLKYEAEPIAGAVAYVAQERLRVRFAVPIVAQSDLFAIGKVEA